MTLHFSSRRTVPSFQSHPGLTATTGRRWTIAAAVLASVVGAPAVASAGTVTAENGALVFRAAPGEANDLYVNDEGGEIVFDDTASIAAVGVDCNRGEFEPAGRLRCVPQPGGIRAELGDGNDVGRLGSGWTLGTPIAIDGGPGDDRLSGYAGPETLHGGDGNDVLEGNDGDDYLFGDAGNDSVDGDDGADEVRGGDGDDLVAGGGRAQFADIIDGGAGRDTLSEYEYTAGGSQPAPTAPISLTVDGVADDGRPGEGDNVTDVEVAKLLVAASIAAGPGPVELSVFRTQALPSRLIGSAQADTLTGFDYDDVIAGGAGDDTIVGSYGNDTINPGPGRDSVNADTATACNFFECRPAYGNDTVDARDGEVDSITCGVGQDRVLADAADVVAADCETVERSGASGGPNDKGKSKGGQGGNTGKAKKLGVTVPKKLTAKAVRRGTKLSVTTPKAGKLTLTLTRKVGRKARTFATGKATAKAAGTIKVRLKAGKAQRAKLGRGSYRLKLTLHPKSGKATSVTRTVKVR
jgi:hypothetical protein